ncbi:thioredoxin domain-containing protein [Alteromonas macleodii]|uniref:thioredoxin domain-containing protein n=1 Tax=Alteromonas macleodii TaxID=28108 RepID=UPI00314072ED
MIRLLLLMLFSVPTFAKTYIVEIADFSCKYCYEAEHYTHKIRIETQHQNDEFVFAPVSFGESSRAEELLYYATKEDPNLEKFVRDALFELRQKQNINVSSMSELLDWLSIYYSNKPKKIQSIKNELAKDFQNFNNIKAYIKALRLVKDYKIESTPTFLIIDDLANISVVKKPEKMPVPEYIDHVLDMYKRISKNED